MVKDLEPLEDGEYEEEEEEEGEEVLSAQIPATAGDVVIEMAAEATEDTAQEGQPAPSQELLAAALAAQSSFRSKSRPDLTFFKDLPAGDAKVQLCRKDADGNGRNIYCSRQGCGSLILATGVANWVVAEGGVVSSEMTGIKCE